MVKQCWKFVCTHFCFSANALLSTQGPSNWFGISKFGVSIWLHSSMAPQCCSIQLSSALPYPLLACTNCRLPPYLRAAQGSTIEWVFSSLSLSLTLPDFQHYSRAVGNVCIYIVWSVVLGAKGTKTQRVCTKHTHTHRHTFILSLTHWTGLQFISSRRILSFSSSSWSSSPSSSWSSGCLIRRRSFCQPASHQDHTHIHLICHSLSASLSLSHFQSAIHLPLAYWGNVHCVHRPQHTRTHIHTHTHCPSDRRRRKLFVFWVYF